MLLDFHTAGECHVREVKDLPPPDTVDRPKLSIDGSSAVLRYRVADQAGGGVAEAVFDDVLAIYLGYPNADALNTHRMYAKGVRFYSWYEVLNSDWVADVERRNRVHPGHIPGMSRRTRHFIATFNDETFECLATTFEVSHEKKEPKS